MAHAYCNECQAEVTVRAGACLLDHAVDAGAVSNRPGRRASSPHRARHERGPQRPLDNGRRPTTSAGMEPPTRYATITVLAPSLTATLAPPRPVTGLDRTGPLIEALWNTPESNAAPWDFVSIPEQESQMDRRPTTRWVGSLVLVVGLAVGVLAIIRLVDATPRGPALAPSQEQYSASIVELSAVLSSVAAGEEVDPVTFSAGIASADAAARRLFSAADSVDDPVTRQEVLNRADLLLTVVAGLKDVNMLESVTLPLLVPPSLPLATTPEEAATVASEIAVWQASLTDALELVPSRPATEAALDRMGALVSGLEDWKAGYLAHLREGNDPANLVEALSTDTEATRQAVSDAVTSAAAVSLEQLAAIPG